MLQLRETKLMLQHWVCAAPAYCQTSLQTGREGSWRANHKLNSKIQQSQVSDKSLKLCTAVELRDALHQLTTDGVRRGERGRYVEKLSQQGAVDDDMLLGYQSLH